MATNMSVYNNVLKEDYASAIEDQIVNSNFLLQKLQRKGEETLQGREFVMPIHVSRNTGVGARLENDDLPLAGRQGYAVARFTPAMVAGSIEVTEQVIQATRNDRGSFVRALQNEIEGLVTDFKKNVQRQLHGDGTGLLAAITVGGTGVVTFTVNSVRYLQVGMNVDILVRTTGATNVLNRTITAINRDTRVVTVNGANFTPATVDGLYGVNTYGKELLGLQRIADRTSVLYGINPTTESLWAANVLHNSAVNRAITEPLLQQAWDLTEEIGDAQPDVVMTTFGVRRAYQNLLTSLKRFTSPLQMDGGWSALEYNGKPMLVDHDCPTNRVYFLPMKHLALYQYSNPGWMDRDGDVLRRLPSRASYSANYLWFLQLACNRRNAITLLNDITEA